MGKKTLIVQGGDYSDTLQSSSTSNSKVYGNGGDDGITGNYNAFLNELYGGDGNDRITGTPSSRRIDGGYGDDSIATSAVASQFILGGDGADYIDFNFSPSSISFKKSGRIVVDGGLGDDEIRVRSEYSSAKRVTTYVYGGDGNDKLNLDRHKYHDRLVYDLGAGDDILTLWNVPEPRRIVVTGGVGSDTINSGAVSGDYLPRQVRAVSTGIYELAYQSYQINGVGYEQVIEVRDFEYIQYYSTNYSLSDLSALGTQLPWL